MRGGVWAFECMCLVMWVHGVLDQFVMMSADNAVDVVCWDCWCVLVITGLPYDVLAV